MILPRDTHAWLAALRPPVARLLGVDESAVDPTARLFDLGLDSLHATRLAAELTATLARPVSPLLLWQHPTLADLAAHLAGALESPTTTTTASPTTGPTAILGMACRFPRSPDLAAFWRLLAAGVDATTEVPADRWDTTRWHDRDPSAPGKSITARGAFLPDVRGFEPLFFGISPREADELDPHQRLALELTWEALEDAGVPPRSLAGTATGVYFGAMWHDWADLTHADVAGMTAHRATGTSNNLIANRVSYALGLRGPSMVVDTACSSGLVALHLAVQALALGEVDLAIVGAVNLLLAPTSMVFCSKFGGLAPDGRCKAFDAAADGFGRGEGGGVVVLRRLADADPLRDRVWARVRGSAINNGASQGLTAPSPRAQKDVLRAALARAGLPGDAVHLVEAHGTGTFLGDPIETAALGAVLGHGRPADRPLLVGSVKTNIAHTEAAAGLAGLIKTTLALHHRAVPPSLHLHRPNPHIPFDALHLRVPTALEPWPATPDVPAIAGVSAFGWGGTNAHVLLESPPPAPRFHALAAATPDALAAQLEALRAATTPHTWPATAPTLEPAPHRLATCARTPAELLAQLDAALARRPHDGLFTSTLELAHTPSLAPVPSTSRSRDTDSVEPSAPLAPVPSASRSRDPDSVEPSTPPAPVPSASLPSAPAIVFVCSPLGSQWPGMARLLADEPAFRAAIHRCDRALAPHLGRSIRDDLAGAWTVDDDVVRAQPLLFAVQVALAELLRSWGVTPTAVLGHSAGEIAAAHIAGALDLEQAAAVIHHYARVQQPGAGRGAMAVVALPPEQLADRLAAAPDGVVTSAATDPLVAIAAHNSATSTVVSGHADAVAALLRTLQSEGITCSQIRSDVAGHSPLVRDGLPELTRALADLRPSAPAVPLLSTVTGSAIDRPLDATYWADNLGHVVRFREAVAHILTAGPALFIELGPHPVVAHALRECAAQHARPARVVTTLRRGLDDRHAMLTARAALFAAGAATTPPLPPPELLLLSARSPAALAATAERLAAHLADHPRLNLRDVAHTTNLGRTHLEHRLAVVGRTRDDLISALRTTTTSGPVHARPRLVFVFPGQGSQWPGMARGLLRDEPVFRARLLECDRALAPHLGASILDELHAPSPRLDHSDIIQPALWAVGLALAELLKDWGLAPDAVVGHSMGEVAAACVAGSLDLDDGARIIATRSRIARAHAGGAMAVVELSLPDALGAVADVSDRLVVGVHNGPRECVLSGDPDALARVLADLDARGVFTRRVKVDYASHSPAMDALRPALLAALAGITPRPGRVPMLSTRTADWQPGERLDAAYWAAGIRDRVRFADAIQRLLAASPTADDLWRGQPRVFLEVSPHPVLTAAIRDALPGPADHRALGTLRRDEHERTCLLTAAGALHTAGVDLDLARLHPEAGRVVTLPPVAWQRTPHWFAEPVARPHTTTAPTTAPGHPILAPAFTTPAQPGAHYFPGRLDPAAQPYLADHRVGDATVVPAATWLDLALVAATAAITHQSAWTLADITFHEALILPPHGADIQIALTPGPDGWHTFDCHGRAAETWTRHASGRLRPVPETSPAQPVPADSSPPTSPVPADSSPPAAQPVPGASLPATQPVPAVDLALLAAAPPVPGDTFYVTLARRGLRYGPRCRGVLTLRTVGPDVLADLAAPDPTTASVLPPVLLDAALHALVAAAPADARPLVPVAIRELHLRAPIPSAPLRALGRLTGDGAVTILDATDRPLVELTGLELRRLAPTRVRDDDLLALAWHDLPPLPTRTPRPHRWLLAATPDDPVALRLRDLLQTTGDHVHLLPHDADPTPLLTTPWHGLLHLAPPPPPTLTWTDALDTTATALRHAQALLKTTARDLPRLWLVTRGATASDGAPPTLAHAPLWGLGLTLAHEHPELRCARVDLSAAPDDAALHALVAALRADDHEDQLALRGDRRLGARLVSGSVAAADLDLTGPHLITGGLGDLGLALAEWLVAHGCRALVLLGRGGVTRPEQSAAIARMRAAGADVAVHRVDVADPTALSTILADLPDLAGVFHAAAVLDDGLVASQDRDRLARVMSAKIAGALNLHQLTRHLPLRTFVLYSSAASLLGSPGQSNYAAANAFLDALAEHRRALGLPALAIHWGAVADVGLAARDARRGARLAARGLLPLTLERAHDHLARLLADPTLTRIGVIPLDLRQWLESHPTAAAAPLFHELRATKSAPITAPRAELATLPPAERARRISDLLRAEVQRVLRVDAARAHRGASLVDLGLDSLTGLELRNRLEASLGLRLPATLAWTHPRLDLFAADLDARLTATLATHNLASATEATATTTTRDGSATSATATRDGSATATRDGSATTATATRDIPTTTATPPHDPHTPTHDPHPTDAAPATSAHPTAAPDTTVPDDDLTRLSDDELLKTLAAELGLPS